MARESSEVQQGGPAFDGLDERHPDVRPVHQPVGDDVGRRPWLPQQRLVPAVDDRGGAAEGRLPVVEDADLVRGAVPVGRQVAESSDRREEVVEAAGEVAVGGAGGRQVDVPGERRTRRARPGGRSGRRCVRAAGAPFRTAAGARAPRRRRRCPPARDRSGRRSGAAAAGWRPPPRRHAQPGGERLGVADGATPARWATTGTAGNTCSPATWSPWTWGRATSPTSACRPPRRPTSRDGSTRTVPCVLPTSSEWAAGWRPPSAAARSGTPPHCGWGPPVPSSGRLPPATPCPRRPAGPTTPAATPPSAPPR